MDLIDQLRALSNRLPVLREHARTEEATKHALVLPFIAALGYSVFDPTEVVPEFVCDAGTKKGEKIDYALMRDGKPTILFECKQAGANLDEVHFNQLLRYYHVTSARIGVLTNGIQYRFFTDLEEPNKMDAKPFLEFNLTDVNPAVVEEVKRLAKSTFNLDEVLGAAVDLKYTKEIKRILAEQMDEPADEFVRFFTSRVFTGLKTQKVLQQFTDITRRAMRQFVNERINERLKSALGPDSPSVEASRTVTPVAEPIPVEPAKIVTTEEEREAVYLVKGILSGVVDPRRIVMRDAESYCSVLLDDNNRKPICRLRLGVTKKQIGLFDAEKKEERHLLGDIHEIYAHAERLRATVALYESAVKT